MPRGTRTKKIHLRGARAVGFGFPGGQDAWKYLYSVSAPAPGDFVSNPFTAYGNLDDGATSADVTVTSKSTQQTYNGRAVDPPEGADWAFEFNVPQGQYYLTDVEEGGGTYTVDPVNVMG